MIFDEVAFKKFAVDPKSIMASLPQYKPRAWNEGWEVVFVPQGIVSRIYDWCKDHLDGEIDVVITHDGDTLVGFTNPTDAILFKISYYNGV